MSLELNPITTPDQIGGFNVNFELIENYVNENLLNRQGTASGEPNQMEEDLDMNGHYILNVETDLSVGNSILSVGTADSRYIQKAGSAMTGNLNMSGNFLTNVGTPVSEDQATNKAYVDAADLAERIFTENGLDGKLDKTGGTVTGFISMAGNKIYNLADPTDPNEGANKRYVDSILPDEIQLNILKGRADTQEAELDTLRIEYDAHIVDYNSHIDDYNAHIDTYNAHIVDYNGHIDDYDAHIVTYNNHVLDFDQLHSEFDAHIVAYNSFVTSTDAHIASTDNPHSVTKAQVGLGSVDNVSAANLRDRATHTGTQTLATISDSGTSAGKDSTSSRTSTSTNLVLEAAAMEAHTGSGDHDARYYQKSEFETATVADAIGPHFTAMPLVGGDAIVDSGTNSDGNWIRYANGTQICTALIPQSGQWNFPMPFSTTTGLIPMASAYSAAQRFASTSAVTTTSLQAHGWATAGGANMPINLYAIGRWK